MTFPSPFSASYFPEVPFQAPSLDDNKKFLEEGDSRDSIKLWDSKSGYPFLLKAKSKKEIEEAKRDRNIAILGTLLLAYFLFREDRGIYQYGYYDPISGRSKLLKIGALSGAVKMGVLRISKAIEIEARILGGQLVNGSISIAEWHYEMSVLLRTEYRAVYLASIGGVENLGVFELQHFSSSVGFYFERLGNLAEKLARGELKIDGRVVGWSGMYARAGNSIFWNSSLKIAQRNGMREARRILGPNENHCLDSRDRQGCFELAEQGWVAIDQMVELGDATCLSNCLCGMQFRR